MSEEQTWVHHAGLDRWSQVPGTSLDTWAALGWEHHPEGPPLVETRYSDQELIKRAEELGTASPALPDAPPVEAPPAVSEVSIQTPAAEASTEPTS